MTYRNRYGEQIMATWLTESELLRLKGVLNLGIRTFQETNGEIQSIDFMGGPMIHVQDDLGTWYPDLSGYRVQKLTIADGVQIHVNKQ